MGFLFGGQYPVQGAHHQGHFQGGGHYPYQAHHPVHSHGHPYLYEGYPGYYHGYQQPYHTQQPMIPQYHSSHYLDPSVYPYEYAPDQQYSWNPYYQQFHSQVQHQYQPFIYEAPREHSNETGNNNSENHNI